MTFSFSYQLEAGFVYYWKLVFNTKTKKITLAKKQREKNYVND